MGQVRIIITKQALQEGWDCPFAYMLCSLAPVTNKKAITQLIGRVLRQPDTLKTGTPLLDEAYVFCTHTATGDIVDAIKKGLEQDGMGDLTEHINSRDSTKQPQQRTLKRRKTVRNLKIYLPEVNWVDGHQMRKLDYEQDILFKIDWEQISLEEIIDKIPDTTQAQKSHFLKLGLVKNTEDGEWIEENLLESAEVEKDFDPVYIVRSISDIVPNPWIARCFVEYVISHLQNRGDDVKKLGIIEPLILETMRKHLIEERDRLAKTIFMEGVESGKIQFRLRADRRNWSMPNELPTQRDPNSQELRRGDGQYVQRSLFEPAYKDDLNEYEQKVACYLDGEKALRWWYRNVAQQQYSLQGWRKNKIFPDFIFALGRGDNKEKIMILETKGNHLKNPDTKYKETVMETCTNAFKKQAQAKKGELELIIDGDTTVNCALIFEETWKTDLSKLLEN